jgi:hypothetical protein
MHRSLFDEASVKLETQAGELFQGKALDVRSEGHEVLLLTEFPASVAPLLQLGAKTRLTLSGASLPTAIRAEGSVTFRRDDDDRRAYHFLLEEHARRPIALLVNRRKAIRVRPTTMKPVVVTVAFGPEDAGFQAAVHDVSSTGISIGIHSSLEASLYSVSKLWLTIELPEERHPIPLVGRIRNRRLTGSTLVYGLEFEQEDKVDFLVRQDQILRFVLKRYSEETRQPERG